MFLRRRAAPVLLLALPLAGAAFVPAAPVRAADRANITVSATVLSQCAASVPDLPGAADARAALRGTRVACAAATPYDVTAIRADRAPLPQASWAANGDGTVLVTIVY